MCVAVGHFLLDHNHKLQYTPWGSRVESDAGKGIFPQPCLIQMILSCCPVQPYEWKLFSMTDPLAGDYLTGIPRYRKRNLGYSFGEPWAYYVGGSLSQSGRYGDLKFLEETWDETHPYFYPMLLRERRDAKREGRKVKGWALTDNGGAFLNQKVWCEPGKQVVRLASSPGAVQKYNGPLFAAIGTDTAYSNMLNRWKISPSLGAILDSYGATAISRCAPTSPHASAYTAIGEIYREGLPVTPGLTTAESYWQGLLHDTNISHAAGNEYLNYEFGILPVISDIQQLGTAIDNASSIIKQYKRDAGRLVRRRYNFPSTEELVSRTVATSTQPVGGGPFGSTAFCTTLGETVTTVTDTTDRWFSGAFTYRVVDSEATNDPLDNFVHQAASMVREAQLLTGLAPTSAALWNFAPWSWAADWVTNIGDVMNNISMYQSDGLLMRWGYIMERKLRKVEYHHRGSVFKLEGGGTMRANLTQTFYIQTERRRRATPFGFGFDLSHLTGRQEAIIAALALTR